jgi:hypothetical protein
MRVTTAGSCDESTSSSNSSQASALRTPPPGVDDRPLRHGDRVRSFPQLLGVDRSWRFPPRQVDLVGVNEVELRLLDVFRDVDEHRALAAVRAT